MRGMSSNARHLSDQRPGRAPIPGDQVGYLVATAARAPSLHNTQPWRFRIALSAVEVHADRRRGLPAEDPAGGELLISCGAAIFGLRLAIRHLGPLAGATLLPGPPPPGAPRGGPGGGWAAHSLRRRLLRPRASHRAPGPPAGRHAPTRPGPT